MIDQVSLYKYFTYSQVTVPIGYRCQSKRREGERERESYSISHLSCNGDAMAQRKKILQRTPQWWIQRKEKQRSQRKERPREY
jgi:hypothetical protein